MSAYGPGSRVVGGQHTISQGRYFRHGRQSSGTSELHRYLCNNLCSVVQFDDEHTVEPAFSFLTSHNLASTITALYCHIE